MRNDQRVGSILGTAIGDAMGLPYEGLSRRRAARLLGPPNQYRFLLNWGMVSDDTEHTCMVAQALIASGGDVLKFQRHLAWGLRWWLLTLPAGIGLATLKSILRLWCGFKPAHSGTYSAGNGPAMRAALLGVAIADLDQLQPFVRASSRLTHTDPRAEYGALTIALAARYASVHDVCAHDVCESEQGAGEQLLQHLQDCGGEAAHELILRLRQALNSVARGESTVTFAASLGLAQGVSGYVYDSVPVAVHAWLSHPHDFRAAIVAAIECGGDTDSIAAMVGGIVGAGVGKAGLPREWLEHLWEPLASVPWMERLALQLDATISSGQPAKPLHLPFFYLGLRNLFFLVIVLVHGFRRLLPPY